MDRAQFTPTGSVRRDRWSSPGRNIALACNNWTGVKLGVIVEVSSQPLKILLRRAS
jgi:hypothetical protein